MFGLVAWNRGVWPSTRSTRAPLARALLTWASSREKSNTPLDFSMSRQFTPESHRRTAPTFAAGQETGLKSCMPKKLDATRWLAAEAGAAGSSVSPSTTAAAIASALWVGGWYESCG